jgi:hypothetical protein
LKVSNFIKSKNYDNFRLFNQLKLGDILEYYGIKTFIDSRVHTFSIKSKDDNPLLDYKTANSGISMYKKVFSKYNISHVLVEKKSFLGTYLNKDKDFSPVYQDEDLILFYKLS